MAKVVLLREKHCDFYMQHTKRVAKMLPFYEREGKGYVHRVRSATHHYDEKTGELRHTSVHFWCGLQGFLDPAGRRENRRRNPAMVCSEPSPGRVVCATCEGRAIGAGQVQAGRIGDTFVKYRPHVGFMTAPPPP